MKKKLSLQTQSSLNRISFFIEFPLFLFVVFALVLPCILNERIFVIPSRPETLQEILYFLVRIFVFATFEELIYRVYLPTQMTRLYVSRNRYYNQLKKKEKYIFHIISNIFFAFAHSYLGVFNILFAFISGIIFSLIYEYVNKKLNMLCAVFLISLFHFFYNSVAFYFIYSFL